MAEKRRMDDVMLKRRKSSKNNISMISTLTIDSTSVHIMADPQHSAQLFSAAQSNGAVSTQYFPLSELDKNGQGGPASSKDGAGSMLKGKSSLTN